MRWIPTPPNVLELHGSPPNSAIVNFLDLLSSIIHPPRCAEALAGKSKSLSGISSQATSSESSALVPPIVLFEMR